MATAIFMQMLLTTILNTALPAIAADFGENAVDLQLVIISYVLTLALFIPVSGFLADKYGTKNIFITALLVFAIGSVFCAVSQTLETLVFSRIIQGLGGSLMTPVARLALIRSFPKNQLVRAMNYAIIPALLGPIVGPILGGYFVDYLHWHYIFWSMVPVALLAVVLSWRYMPDLYQPNARLDIKGFLLIAAASLVLTVAFEWMGNPTMLSWVFAGLILGALFFFSYYKHALSQSNALFPLLLFQIRTFRIGFFGNLVSRLGISAVPLLLPLLLQLPFGQSATTAGWIMAPLAIGAMISKSMVIPVLRRFGYRNVLRINTLVIGCLIMSMAIPPLGTSIYWFVPMAFVLGVFNSIQFTSMNSISVSRLRDDITSSGNSLLALNQQLAIGFGLSIGLTALRIFDQTLGQGTGDSHIAFRITFVVVGLLTALSSLVFRQLHDRDGDNLRA